MYDNDSKGISYTAGFFILICFVLAGLLASGLLMQPVWTSMTGKSFEVFQEGQLVAADSNALKVMQVITAVMGFLLPTILAAFMLNRKPFRLLGFSAGTVSGRQVGLVVLIMAAALFVSTSLASFTDLIPLPSSWKAAFDRMEDDYNRQVSAIISLKSVTDYILALIVMAFLPALCEEALFRGGLQNFLSRGTGKPWLAIIAVSVLFSLAHISYYGLFPRLFLGIVLGALFQYSGRLWLCVLGHFINNALAITVLYVNSRQGIPLEEAMRDNGAGFWGLLALPVLIVLFMAFRKVITTERRSLY